MSKVRIKICGFTRKEDLENAVNLGVDAVGFVLYQKSSRYVSIQRVKKLITVLPPFISVVLLFVNEKKEIIDLAINEFPNAILQFHGDESLWECCSYNRNFIKVARIKTNFNLLEFTKIYNSACGILLDSFSDEFGGSGKTFDWSIIPESFISTNLILSGGLNNKNVQEGIIKLKNRCLSLAVDISSGVEIQPGIKSKQKMQEFIKVVNSLENI